MFKQKSIPSIGVWILVKPCPPLLFRIVSFRMVPGRNFGSRTKDKDAVVGGSLMSARRRASLLCTGFLFALPVPSFVLL